jgi:hypothetical protein
MRSFCVLVWILVGLEDMQCELDLCVSKLQLLWTFVGVIGHLRRINNQAVRVQTLSSLCGSSYIGWLKGSRVVQGSTGSDFTV